VTPNKDAGDPLGQNVDFYVGNNANQGLQAETPSVSYGASFRAVAVYATLSGELRFIQNIKGLDNGYNGTTNINGAPAGWLYADGSSANWQLDNATFPMLDIDAGDPDQTYVQEFTSTISPDKTTMTITDNDSPWTQSPDNAPNGIAEDVRFRPRLYLVWRWIQTVQGNSVSVFYPLAYTNWQVNFYAKADFGIPPIKDIVILNGVSSDGSNTYTASNAPPEALNMTPYFNFVNVWRSS